VQKLMDVYAAMVVGRSLPDLGWSPRPEAVPFAQYCQFTFVFTFKGARIPDGVTPADLGMTHGSTIEAVPLSEGFEAPAPAADLWLTKARALQLHCGVAALGAVECQLLCNFLVEHIDLLRSLAQKQTAERRRWQSRRRESGAHEVQLEEPPPDDAAFEPLAADGAGGPAADAFGVAAAALAMLGEGNLAALQAKLEAHRVRFMQYVQFGAGGAILQGLPYPPGLPQ
jgi:hypothetical protein